MLQAADGAERNASRLRPVFEALAAARNMTVCSGPVHELSPPNMTLDWLRRLRSRIRGKLILMGIVTGEDAALALREGVEAVLEIYAKELQAIMRQAGTRNVTDIGPRAVLHRGI